MNGKAISVLVVFALLGSGLVWWVKGGRPTPAATAASAALAADVTAWPGMGVDQFGCLLETKLGHRDPKFNCALAGYQNTGDPCKNVDAYYEGPELPDAVVRKLGPSVKGVQVSFEHGRVQSVGVFFRDKATKAEIEKRVGYRGPRAHANLVSASTDACRPEGSCISLEAFEHMGAADVDCGPKGS